VPEKDVEGMSIGPVFCKVLLATDKMNLYGSGPLRNLKTGKDLRPGATPDDKEMLRSLVMKFWSTGCERAKQFAKETCFDETPPKKGVDLTKMQAHESRAAADDSNLVKRMTTMDEDYLKAKGSGNVPNATAEFLKAEFKWLKERVGKEDGFPKKMGQNKNQLAKSVSMGRKVFVESNAEGELELKDRADSAIESRNANMVTAASDDLDTPMFKLKESVRSLFKEKTCLSKRRREEMEIMGAAQVLVLNLQRSPARELVRPGTGQSRNSTYSTLSEASGWSLVQNSQSPSKRARYHHDYHSP